MPKPWKDLLDICHKLPRQTQQEVIAGRMALIKNHLKEEQEAYNNLIEWDTFDMQVAGYAQDVGADALFRLEDFTTLNDGLVRTMAVWGIKGIRAACCRLHEDGTEIIRVKVIIPPAEKGGEDTSMSFDEDPKQPFPSEELMTKLQLVNPGDGKS